MMTYKTGINTDNIIRDLQQSVNFWTKTIQHFCFKRVRKIRTVDIFEFVLQLAANETKGSSDILMKMYKNNISPENIVSKSTMSDARDKVVVNMWKAVFSDVSDSLRKEIKTRRIFAIDGSVLVLQNADFGGKFKKSNGSYLPHAYASVLYDIDYGFPIDVVVSDKLDERSAAIEHLKYLKPGDIVVMDRGYYSKALFNIFHDAGVHVLFRMKSNTSKAEWEKEENDILSSKDGIDCRFVKYEVNSVKYMILTNLNDNSIDPAGFIQLIYHKRWGIETAFGYTKDVCSLANLHARTVTHLVEEFYANFLLFTIARLVEYHSINRSAHNLVGGYFNRNVLKPNGVNGKYDQKVNFKQCISQTNDSLRILLSANMLDEFEKLSKIILIGLSPIRGGRHFDRLSLQSNNKWVHHRSVRSDSKQNDNPN